MKNIYIVDEFQSAKQNGLGVFVKELASFLKADMNVSIIYTNSDNEEFTIKEEENITLYHIPVTPINPFNDGAETTNLFINLWIKDQENNVFVVNHSPCNELLTSLKETYPLSKIIFVIHDLAWRMILEGNVEKYKEIIGKRKEEETKKEHQGLIDIFENELKFLSLADKVVCLTQDTLNLLLDVYLLDNNKVILINNGLSKLTHKPLTDSERETVRKSLHISEEEKILLYVGRVNKMKGGDALLKCFNDVLREYPNCRIVVLGNLNGSKTLSQIGDATCKVSFTGHLKKEDVHKWYSIADIGLVVSYTEQCSYSAMEIMMYGLPIVASDGYGVQNMFKNQENALVAKIGDRESEDEYANNLSSAIIKLLKSEDLQKTLSKASKQLFEEKYESIHMGEKYKKLIIN